MAENSVLKAEIVRLLDHASDTDLQAILEILRPRQPLPAPLHVPQSLDVQDMSRVDFNILKISENIGVMCTFLSVVHALSEHYSVHSALQCQDEVLARFIQAIGLGYKDNAYHNALHAADVSQSVHIVLVKGGVEEATGMSRLAVTALFLSAFTHDYGHPGVNNKYLVKSGHALALRYNDASPLENYHLAQTFALARKPQLAIFDRLTYEEKTSVREQIIRNVLGTDVNSHSKVVSDAKMLARDASQQKNQSLVQPIILSYSDIANVMKPPSVMMQWGRWINEEFFLQVEKELAEHLPPSFPFTRETANIVTNQKSFIEGMAVPLLLPMTEVWVGLRELLEMVRENIRYLSIQA